MKPRFELQVLLFSLAGILSCMRSPNVDPSTMTCKTEDNCLPGYSCVAGICQQGRGRDASSFDGVRLDQITAEAGSADGKSATSAIDGTEVGMVDAPDGPLPTAPVDGANSALDFGASDSIRSVSDLGSPDAALGNSDAGEARPSTGIDTRTDSPNATSTGGVGVGGVSGTGGSGGGPVGTGGSIVPDASSTEVSVDTFTRDVPEGCLAPMHDDGTGNCVPSGCASGYHNGGDGSCVGAGTCVAGYHDNGVGTCVGSGCASGYHDGGDNVCVVLGQCSNTYHDGGDGSCVALSACSIGFHNDGTGKCVASGCASGHHDGGDGVCVLAGGCSSSYHDNGLGTCVKSGCATGYHDGGDGACRLNGSCSVGYHDGGGDVCTLAGTCASGYHDGGDGACTTIGACSAGFGIGTEGDCLRDGTALWARSSTAGPRSSWFPAVTVDSQGNVYAAGSIYSADTYSFGSGVSAVGVFTQNAILVKYDPTGKAIWARTPTQAPGVSRFWSVAVDAGDNVLAAGTIDGTGTYAFGSTASTAGGFTGGNLLLVKYDSSGNALWASSATTATASSAFTAVAVNRTKGDIYAAGSLGAGGTFDIPKHVSSLTAPATGGAFWLRFDSSGSATAAWVIQGSGSSGFSGITVDSAGNLFAAGRISGTDTFTFNSTGSVATSGTAADDNLLLVRYDVSGAAMWAKSVASGNSASWLSGVAADSGGNTYVSGIIHGTGTYDLGNGTAVAGTSMSNALIAKYDLSGQAQWAKAPNPGPSTSQFSSISCDSTGIYAGGQISTTATYTFGTGVSVAGAATNFSALLVKYDLSGEAVWARSSISGPDSFFTGVAVGSGGEVYASGELYGTVEFSSGVSATGSAGINMGCAALVRYVP